MSDVMRQPRVEKITVNIGVGEAGERLVKAQKVLEMVTGQKPKVTQAKVTNRDLGVREGMPIGCKVTLRGDRALHFLDKLATVVLPRIRDFQGLPANSFDGRGNYSLGLKEQLVFPEIPYDTFDRLRGMDIVICTTAKNDEEGRAFLKMMGMPIREK